MTAQWPNPELRRKHERQAGSLARAMLRGEERYVAGAQRMLRLLIWLRLADDDPDLIAFRTIVARTSHLPVGAERQQWDAAALAEKDRELAGLESWAEQLARGACERLARGAADGR